MTIQTPARRAHQRADDAAHPQAGTPWWRHRIMWLVVGGPLAVVVAGIVTAVIAVRGADPVLDTRADRAPERPALEGRNHAASPEPRR
ncbi:MAG: nitrogen fixation protein FixH [Burkholderiales bacterium]|nr:nitrogen fixation protein FixH [Burkholderiales bacterium]